MSVQDLFRRRRAFSRRYGMVVPVLSYWECHDMALCLAFFGSSRPCVKIARAVDLNYGALK
eukprot:2582249-Rhodomonas_salina.1